MLAQVQENEFSSTEITVGKGHAWFNEGNVSNILLSRFLPTI